MSRARHVRERMCERLATVTEAHAWQPVGDGNSAALDIPCYAMPNTALRSQRAQTQSRAAREPISISERLAFSPKEVAATLGKSPTYVYRQIYAGRIKPISNAGRLLISRIEVDAFLTRAADYNPSQKQKTQNNQGPQ